MYNWWMIYSAPTAKLQILVINDDSQVVAIAPFYLKLNYLPLPHRSVYFLGTGEPEHMEVFSEYLDIIMLHTRSNQILLEISNYFSNEFVKWDKLEFLRVLNNSYISCLAILGAGNSQRFKAKSICGYRYIVSLPETWREYTLSLKSSMRRSINKAQLVIHGDQNITCERVNGKKNVSDTMFKLAQLHTESWRQKGKPGAFSSSKFCEFHHKISINFTENDMLELLVFKYRDEVMAMLYNFKIRSTIYYYQSAFNMLKYSNLSPGVLAHSECIKNAIENNYDSYDFMLGGSNSYKSRYGSVKKEMNNIVFYNNSLMGRLMSLVFKIRN